MEIQVAGPGCPRCISTEKNVKEALRQLRKEVEVEHLTDMREISKRGVMFTPAVIIDGEIVTSGKIPTVEELKEIISKLPT